MKSTLKKIFSPLNLFLLIWPFVLWFIPSYFVQEMPLIMKQHPLEYIIIFFLINIFGVGAVMTITHKDALDELYPFVHDLDIDDEMKMKIREKLSRVLRP